jgi:hypothetical protein
MIAELRRIRRWELSRLRALSVEVSELAADLSRKVIWQFAEQFVGPERARQFLSAVETARFTGREVDYSRWMRQDARVPRERPGVAWLSRGRLWGACIRFDRRAIFRPLEMSMARMEDEWVLSWPGAYVSFDTRRAMSVSIDYEVTCCDLSSLGASPYR